MQKNHGHSSTEGEIASNTQDSVVPTSLESEIHKHLNFKVSAEFHRKFKIYAANNGMSMTALLIAAFNDYCKEKY